jgi:hypothetical protein
MVLLSVASLMKVTAKGLFRHVGVDKWKDAPKEGGGKEYR